MNLRILLSVYAIFMIAGGVVFFASPSAILGLYGAPQLDVLETALARTVGALMVGLGTVSWAARATRVMNRRDPVMLGLVVTNALWAVACFLTGLAIRGNWFFWTEGAGFAVVTLLFTKYWHREIAQASDPAAAQR